MLDQTDRAARLTTPLGASELVLARFTADEGLSQLYEVTVEAVSSTPDINFDKLLGRGCAVTSAALGAEDRHFHGLVTHAEWIGMRADLHIYSLTLRPWLWLLGKTSDCRIFHDKSVVDIIKATFADHSLGDYRCPLTADYPILHYTVQYRETDLNFVCRLMEQHGIYYYFEHTESGHTLVLADGPAAHHSAPGLAELCYVPIDEKGRGSYQQQLWAWRSLRDFRSGVVAMNDRNHLTPNSALAVSRAAAESYAHCALEMFDHPGTYPAQGDGAFYARIELEAEQALDRRRQGEGEAMSLYPGALVSLARHPRESENRAYLVVHCHRSFVAQAYRSLDEEGGSQDAPHVFELQPTDRPFRAPLITPKPLINSLHTAIVVGKDGEEIDCDGHGRILVHFPWDRHGDRSCRLRVSQVWGGKGWGGQVIPRIGMEVMVAFIDGDPDRPIVVGSVPDPQNNTVPYALPDKKTKMAWRSSTHKGSGFNEMTFEDENGAQNLFVHAEKDHTQKTKNNHAHRVDANALHSVGANHSLQVANNASHQVGGGMNQVIGLPPQSNPALDAAPAGHLNTDSGAGMASGAAALAQQVAGAVGPGILNQLITQLHNTTTGVAKTEQIGVTSDLTVGQTFNTNVGSAYTIVVGDKFEIVVGKSRFIMDKDGNITVIGVRHTHTASGPIQMNGKVIDLNP